MCNKVIQILRCRTPKPLGGGSGLFAKFTNCWGVKYSLRMANTSCRRKWGIVYIIPSWRQTKINGFVFVNVVEKVQLIFFYFFFKLVWVGAEN